MHPNMLLIEINEILERYQLSDFVGKKSKPYRTDPIGQKEHALAEIIEAVNRANREKIHSEIKQLQDTNEV